MIACWEAKYHYILLAPEPRDPAGGHRREPGTTAPGDPEWFPLVAGNHPEYPSGHACFTGRRDRVAAPVLRNEEGAARDLEHRRRCRPAADVREPRRARRGRRERPRLGRPPLPHDDDRDGQALPADREATSGSSTSSRARSTARSDRRRASVIGRRRGGWTTVHPPLQGGIVPMYLVEVYLPRSRADEARAAGRRARAAAERAGPRGRLDPLRPHDVPAGRRDVLPPLRGGLAEVVEEVSRRAELGRVRDHCRRSTPRVPDRCRTKWREPDLNRRHHGFQPCALPTELPRQERVRAPAYRRLLVVG